MSTQECASDRQPIALTHQTQTARLRRRRRVAAHSQGALVTDAAAGAKKREPRRKRRLPIFYSAYALSEGDKASVSPLHLRDATIPALHQSSPVRLVHYRPTSKWEKKKNAYRDVTQVPTSLSGHIIGHARSHPKTVHSLLGMISRHSPIPLLRIPHTHPNTHGGMVDSHIFPAKIQASTP